MLKYVVKLFQFNTSKNQQKRKKNSLFKYPKFHQKFCKIKDSKTRKKSSKNDITLWLAKLEGVGAGEGSFEEALNVELLAATWFILADPKGLFTAGGEATLVKIPFKI